MTRRTDSDVHGKERAFTENKKDTALRHLMKTLEAVNDKLKESESLKTHFLSNIRNEINNPLTAIMGLSQQLLEGSAVDFSETQNMAEAIYSEAFDLDFQLRNIFAAAELEAGEQSLSISNVDADALVQSVIQSFHHRAYRKNIHVSYSFTSLNLKRGSNVFRTDPEKLRLILSNLLSNAIAFSREGGIIELYVKRDANMLIFSVRDYGIGFSMENETIVFERFRQLDTGPQRRHRGHGLGLSIIKDLADLFGGTISVVSAPDKGSVFIVSVPEAEQAEGIDAFSDDGNVFLF
jgi:two-component system, OmpR family, phosphate regulon sensor histidine kinase PhoR